MLTHLRYGVKLAHHLRRHRSVGRQVERQAQQRAQAVVVEPQHVVRQVERGCERHAARAHGGADARGYSRGARQAPMFVGLRSAFSSRWLRQLAPMA